MSDPIEIGIDESLKVNGDPTKLFEALALASAEFEPVPKMAQGHITEKRPFKYADYSTLMRCARPFLSKHGISVLQPMHTRNGQAITTTIIAGHGASIQASFSFRADPNPQEFGRHHTYYRRYQLQGMLGLAGDEDADDLPNVNTKTQFSEPAKAPAKEPEKAAPKAETKASVAVDKKPAAAQPKTNGSAKPSVATTAPTEPTKPPEVKKAEAPATAPDVALKSINVLLQEGIKSLGWKMSDARAFYKEHVDPAGFESPDNMTIEQKQMLHKKMVEIHDVIPF